MWRHRVHDTPSSRQEVHPVKKYLVPLLKFAIPVVIIVWLLVRVPEDQLQLLRQRPKDWPMLVTAFFVVLGAVCLTFVRWYFLVRALNIPFRMRDAFRLGFLGYLLNFVSAGAVGGDLFKAFFLAREQPDRTAEAVATVIVDRMIGLYALLLLTSGVILTTGIPSQTAEVTTICRMTLAFSAAGAGYRHGLDSRVHQRRGFENADKYSESRTDDWPAHHGRANLPSALARDRADRDHGTRHALPARGGTVPDLQRHVRTFTHAA